MSGASSRRRGHDWERRVARDLSELYGVQAERILHETRDGNVGDVGSNLPLSIQAKCQKRPSVWRALREAEEAAGPGEHPVAAVCRRHGQGKPSERVAVLPWEDFVELLGLLIRCGAW